MQTIYEYTDRTEDQLDVDVLEYAEGPEIMFTNYSTEHHLGISVILPMDEVVKLLWRLTLELDVYFRIESPS